MHHFFFFFGKRKSASFSVPLCCPHHKPKVHFTGFDVTCNGALLVTNFALHSPNCALFSHLNGVLQPQCLILINNATTALSLAVVVTVFAFDLVRFQVFHGASHRPHSDNHLYLNIKQANSLCSLLTPWVTWLPPW